MLVTFHLSYWSPRALKFVKNPKTEAPAPCLRRLEVEAALLLLRPAVLQCTSSLLVKLIISVLWSRVDGISTKRTTICQNTFSLTPYGPTP